MITRLNYLDAALSEIKPDWMRILSDDALSDIDQYLLAESALGHVIYPEKSMIFNALRFVSPKDVRVLILGQDPYHGAGQAMGMSFSVANGSRMPPSLRNIYKELHDDIGCPVPTNGNLSPWAKQGVLLLNSIFTVAENKSASHDKLGWQVISDEIIRLVNEQSCACVFVLWGKYAQKKQLFIDQNRHLVLCAPHPSPFAAHLGFFGCKHFSKINDWLILQGMQCINWAI